VSEFDGQTEVPTRSIDPDSPRRGTHLSYVPALDGIRGVAIIVVMGYHGGVFFSSGGFFSVDMFFTLSGFLITSLLITEWRQTATIRLREFWARRARRLLPALLLLLLGVALYNVSLVVPGTYTHLRWDAISTLFYFANWHFIAVGSSYFGQTGATSPLTHTWSLAIEEQFYLVWPLIVLAVFKLWRSKLVLLFVSVAGALASAIEMAVLYSPAEVNRVYYGTDTRAQCLLVGAALAVALSLWSDHRRGDRFSSARSRVGRRGGIESAWTVGSVAGRRAALAVGLAGVIGSLLLWTLISYNDAIAFRGGFLMAALATAAILISVVWDPRSILATILSFAPLRFVGRISYGLYLWHYPLFLYLDHARIGLTGYALFSVRVAVTLAVATISFYGLERPIRQGTFLRGWRARLASPVAVVAVVIALVAATAAPAQAARKTPVPMKTPGATVAVGPPVKVLWLGDSAALTLGIGMSQYQTSYGIASFDGGIVGCGITDGAEFQLKGIDAPMAPQCMNGPSRGMWPQLWLNDIDSYKPNVVIILAGRWEVANRTYEGQWTNIEDPTYAAYVKQQLQYATRLAGSGGAHVILMTAPCYDTGEQPNGDPWPEDSPSRLSIYNGIVRQVAATTPDTSLINFNAMACPGGRYEEFMDGIQVRSSDGVHFTETGGDVFASRIWPGVVDLGRRQMAHARL